MDKCVYCGEYADTRDHLVANRKRHRYFGKGIRKEYAIQTVPACMTCNCLLGTIPVSEVPRRALHLFLYYKHYYNERQLKWLQEIIIENGL